MTNTALCQLDRDAAEFIGRDPNELAMMIVDIEKEIGVANRANNHLQARYLRNRDRAIQRRLAVDFGALHGWRLSDSEFGINVLRYGKVHSGGDWSWQGLPRPFFDHSYYYRVNSQHQCSNTFEFRVTPHGR